MRLNAALTGRYALVRELGRGGMATVYLAEDLKHHRPVAIKVLRPELAAALGAERFLREIHIAARLTHPHILPIHDSGQVDELLYYVMPYIEGESLRDRLSREKQLSIEDALQVSRDVGKALGYAHSQGIVHRDIKPENILLSAGTAVVADFGIARAIGAAGGERLTETGIAIGTPAYMSPEQAAAGEVDQRSDLYSLACVLYELLAGQPPFTGPTVESILAQHLTLDARPVNALRPAVPLEIAQALGQALAKTPADRFGTAEQFLDALFPRGISPPSGLPAAVPSRTPGRRSKVALCLAVLCALGVVAAIAIYGRFRRRTPAHASGRTMLAVMPFENLGGSADEYFADGLTEEIAGRLGAIPGLGVIARSSTTQYKKTTKSVRQIGDELGVGYLLEGAVRWEKGADGSSRVRVSPQLIRVSDATQLWTERYDEVLASVFEVQGNVAKRVAGALGIALATPDGGAVTKPTDNLEAYDLFLRGNEYFARGTWEGTLLALQMYEKAVGLDHRFALAYVRIGQAHLDLSHTYDVSVSHVRGEDRTARAKAAIDRALELTPGLAEAHLALGRILDDPARRRVEFATAVRLEPDNARAIVALANLQPLQEREPYLKRAEELDPRSREVVMSLGRLYRSLGRYREAESQFDRAIALAPDVPGPHAAKIWLAIDAGEMGKARQALRGAEAAVGRVRWLVSLSHDTNDLSLLRIFREEYRESLLRLSQEAFGADTSDYLLVKAEQYWLTPEPRRARIYFDSLQVLVEAQFRAEPNQGMWHWALAQIYAGLGRRELALGELGTIGKQGEQRIAAYWQAMSFVMLGEADSAIARLESSKASGGRLRVDPIWAPLWGNPRFERLLKRDQTPVTPGKD